MCKACLLFCNVLSGGAKQEIEKAHLNCKKAKQSTQGQADNRLLIMMMFFSDDYSFLGFQIIQEKKMMILINCRARMSCSCFESLAMGEQ